MPESSPIAAASGGLEQALQHSQTLPTMQVNSRRTASALADQRRNA